MRGQQDSDRVRPLRPSPGGARPVRGLILALLLLGSSLVALVPAASAQGGCGATFSVGFAPGGDSDAETEGTLLSYTVSITGATGDVTITYHTDGSEAGTGLTADESAGGIGADFTSGDGSSVLVPTGSPTTVISVATIADPYYETDETVRVIIDNATFTGCTAMVVPGDLNADGTLLNNDGPPTVQFSSAASSDDEGDLGVQTATVTLTPVSGIVATVPYTVLPSSTATAGVDYSLLTPSPLVFTPGQTSKAVQLVHVDDAIDEPGETVTLSIDDPPATVPSQAVPAAPSQHTHTIVDDDPDPAIAIGDATVVEGTGGPSTLSFPVSLSNPKSIPVSVDWATIPGSALAGADFTTATGTVSFAPGETAKVVDVQVLGDSLDEGPDTLASAETLSVSLSNNVPSSGTTVADGTAEGRIIDDETSAYTIDGPFQPEGPTPLAFTVGRTHATTSGATVDYATSSGTAVSGTDFSPASGTLSFAPGEMSKTVPVSLVDDFLDEADEDLTLTLSAPTGPTVLSPAPLTGTGTIVDNEPLPSLAVSDSSPLGVTEGDAGTTTQAFTVTLTPVSGQTVTVSYQTFDGTATAGPDFGFASGLLTFAPGETVKTVVVTVNGDTVDEGSSETYELRLGAASNAAVTDDAGTGTITDDDLSSFQLSSPTKAEGNPPGTTAFDFTVDLPVASAAEYTITFATVAGSAQAGSDYDAVPSPGSVTYAAGESGLKTVTVTVFTDTTDEYDETFLLRGTHALEQADGTATITNDDLPPTVSLAAASPTLKPEGDTGLAPATPNAFTVSLSQPSGKDVAVAAQTTDGSAIDGVADGGAPMDYEALSQTVTLPAGTTTATVTVNVVGDTRDEFDQDFSLSIAAPQNALLGTATASRTIADDDPLAVVSVAAPAPAGEGGPGDSPTLGFTVSVSGATDKTVTVSYATQDVSATSVGANPDYVDLSGTLTFPPGSSPQLVPVPIVGDDVDEPNEQVRLVLSAPANAAVGGTGQAAATILDDDAAPTITVGNPTVQEDLGPIAFPVTLDHPSASAVTVNWSTRDGTAVAGQDYTPASGTATVPAYATSASILVAVGNDALDETATEAFFLDLGAASNGAVGNGPPGAPEAIGTILDEDQPPTVSVGGQTVGEGNTGTTGLQFTILLSAPSGLPVTVSYQTVDGSAASTNPYPDFVPRSGLASIAAGATSATVTVQVRGDSIDEGAESFQLEATSAANAQGTPTAGTGTILDDDTAGLTVLQVDAAGSPDGLTQVQENPGIGSKDYVRLALQSQPVADVVVSFTPAANPEMSLSSAQVTFTPADWGDPAAHQVQVSGEPDEATDGDQATLVTVSVEPSSSAEYVGLPNKSFTVVTVDNDIPGFNVQAPPSDALVAYESGTPATMLLQLNTEPSGTVVLDVAALGAYADQFTATPPTLAFGPSDWNDAKAVVLDAVDDDIVDGTCTCYLQVSVDDAASTEDATYESLEGQIVPVTVVDDDAAGFSLVSGDGVDQVAEPGTSDTVQVVLDGGPPSGGTVRIEAVSGDPGEAVAVPPYVEFTTADWSAPKTFTLLAQDDDYVDGTQAVPFTFAVDDGVSADEFDGLPSQVRVASVLDDDSPGIAIGFPDGNAVSESGTSVTALVSLLRPAFGNVTVQLSLVPAGEASVSPALLTFPAGPAGLGAQAITLTGLDDEATDGVQASNLVAAVVAGASSDEYDGTSGSWPVQTVDDEVPAVLLAGASGLAVPESGSATFGVSLGSQPNGAVEVALSAPPGELTVSPPTLTFSPVDWQDAKTVTLSGVAESMQDGSKPATVTAAVVDVASSSEYDGLAASAAVLLLDDDTASIVTFPPALLSLSEDGGARTVGFRLGSEPASDVALQAATDPGQLTLSATAFTFTPGDWETLRFVTVTGIDNDAVDGDRAVVLQLAVIDAASSAEYVPVPASATLFTVRDDDAPGFALLPDTPQTLTEAAGPQHAAAFDVVLDREPMGAVKVVLSGLGGHAVVSPATLTFTPSTWSASQPVTVTAVDDGAVEGDATLALVAQVDAAVSSDEYDAVPARSVTVTIVDDDTPGIVVQPIGGPATIVSEPSGVATVAVSLAKPPSGNVTVQVASLQPGQATASPATLTFGPATYSNSQFVTMQAVADGVADGDQAIFLSLAVDAAASSDEYDGVAPVLHPVSVLDADAVGIRVLDPDGVQPAEGGAGDSFLVQLASRPSGDVVVALQSDGAGQWTASATQITFTPADWDLLRAVTITAVNDDFVDGDVAGTLTLAVVDAASSPDYDAAADRAVPVLARDDDVASVMVTPLAPLNTTENGTSVPVLVRLGARPASPVTLQVTSFDTTEVQATPATLTFTPSQWASPKVVTLTGVDDVLFDGDRLAVVVLEVASSSSAEFVGASIEPLVVSNADNEARPKVTLSAAPSTLAEDAGSSLVTATLSHASVEDVTVFLGLGGTATVAVDYAISDSLLLVPAGATQSSLAVVASDDDIPEGLETVLVAVNAVSGGTELGQQEALLAIEEEPLPIATLSFAAGPIPEAGGSAVLTVELSDGFRKPVQVHLGFTGGASNGLDYTMSATSVTFAPFETTAQVTLAATQDELDEDDESVTVSIASVHNAVAGTAAVAKAILDDDAAPSVSLSILGSPIPERGGQSLLRASLSKVSGRAVTVTYGFAGSATFGVDYKVSETSLVIPPGIPAAQVVLDAQSDAVAEGDETVAVTLQAASNAALAAARSGVVTIRNEDLQFLVPTIPIGGLRATEASGAQHQVGFQVALTHAPQGPVRVHVTAADPGEVWVDTPILSFSTVDWDQPRTVLLSAVDDGDDDGDRTTLVAIAIDPSASSPEMAASLPLRLPVLTLDDDEAPAPANGTDIDLGEDDDFDITEQLRLVRAAGQVTLAWRARSDADGFQLWRDDGANWTLAFTDADGGALAFTEPARDGWRYKLTYFDGSRLSDGKADDGSEAVTLPGWDETAAQAVPTVPAVQQVGPADTTSEQGHGWPFWAIVAIIVAALANLVVYTGIAVTRARRRREQQAAAEAARRARQVAAPVEAKASAPVGPTPRLPVPFPAPAPPPPAGTPRSAPPQAAGRAGTI